MGVIRFRVHQIHLYCAKLGGWVTPSAQAMDGKSRDVPTAPLEARSGNATGSRLLPLQIKQFIRGDSPRTARAPDGHHEAGVKLNANPPYQINQTRILSQRIELRLDFHPGNVPGALLKCALEPGEGLI